jgi:hypothetical protein
VPVKYGPAEEPQGGLNFLVGASFAMFALLLYRSMHGKGGQNPGANAKKGSNSGSGFGGGLGDLMNMSKSNA